jgi:hypothetical protein
MFDTKKYSLFICSLDIKYDLIFISILSQGVRGPTGLCNPWTTVEMG